MGIVYLDIQKAFDGQVNQRIAIWLSNRQQRVVIDGFNSEWAPVTSGVPQGSVLGPVLFIIYINDVDVGLNNRISKFAEDTKIGYSVLTVEDRVSLQEDLQKNSVWSDRWEKPFNVNKCQVLQVGKKRSSIPKCAALNLKAFNALTTWGSKSRQTSNCHSNASMQQIKQKEWWASLNETFYSRTKM